MMLRRRVELSLHKVGDAILEQFYIKILEGSNALYTMLYAYIYFYVLY